MRINLATSLFQQVCHKSVAGLVKLCVFSCIQALILVYCKIWLYEPLFKKLIRRINLSFGVFCPVLLKFDRMTFGIWRNTEDIEENWCLFIFPGDLRYTSRPQGLATSVGDQYVCLAASVEFSENKIQL